MSPPGVAPYFHERDAHEPNHVQRLLQTNEGKARYVRKLKTEGSKDKIRWKHDAS